MIKREISGFLVVGSASFVIDFLAFNGLLASGHSPYFANFISITLSAIAGLLGNKLISFRHKKEKTTRTLVFRYAVVAILSIAANQILTVFLFRFVDISNVVEVNLAKIGVISVMIGLRFLALKFYVF